VRGNQHHQHDFHWCHRWKQGTFPFSLCGTTIENNSAREGGDAIFFVSNDRSGSLMITDSHLSNNHSAGFETTGYAGIFVFANGNAIVTNSIIE